MNNAQTTPEEQRANEARATLASRAAKRNQWKATNAQAIADADQKRADRDAATIARQTRIDEIASQSINAASVMLELEEERRTDRAKIVDLSEARQKAEHEAGKAEKKAETQRQRADRADADRYERHQQTFKTWEESDLAEAPDDFVYTVEIFLKAFDVPVRNRKTVTDALTNWAKCCSKRPNRAPRQRWELDKEQAQLFYENYIGKGRHQKRHALRAENK